jgi:hypothetical protein
MERSAEVELAHIKAYAPVDKYDMMTLTEHAEAQFRRAR